MLIKIDKILIIMNYFVESTDVKKRTLNRNTFS